MGLFTGRLGIEKVYFLKPRGIDVKIPSDLLGIRAGDYDENNPDINSALRAFSTEVKRLIEKYNTYYFPDSGMWGLNLLSNNINTVKAQGNYSIACKAPIGKTPRILVKPITDLAFGFRVGREIDATVDLEDGLKIVRFLKNQGDKEITFNNEGKIHLTLFEDDISKPILHKEIIIT